MSQPLASQAKQWILLIQSHQFRQVNEELQTYRFKDTEESKSKTLIKVLVYICQTAIDCIKTDPRNAIEVSELCLIVCKNLTSISNTGNFFSSLYHIIRVLLEVKRFHEAMSICDFLLPSSVYYRQMKRENGDDLNEVYSKMWSIFYCSIDKHLKSITPGSLTKSSFQQLLTVLKYQVTIELLSKTDGSKGLLLKLLHYREQLEQLNCTPQQIEEFTDKFYFKLLSSVDLRLGDKNRLYTYQYFTKMANKCIRDHVIKGNFQRVKSILNKLMPNFDSCMAEDEEILKCYQYYKEFCKIILRPLNEFTSREVTAIKLLNEQFVKYVQLNGEEGAVKHNVTSLSILLEAVMSYWMHSTNRPSEQVLINVIVKSAEMLDCYSNVLANYKLESACNCGSKNCSAYEDKQRAAHYKLQAMTILQRLCSKENLHPELFERYMAVSSECVSLLHHLRKNNCNRWKSIWNNAGVSVYNFTVGLTNNYQEVAKLYTFLCQNIVRLKAMEPEYSLFKNNPTPQLSLVLHRLSSIHYTNKNYREAEAYAAINVFLYPMHPECKGYRNWSYVKYQDPESRNQSLVAYYKTNPRQIKELKLAIILTERTMIDICLREIKSHVDIKLELHGAVVAALNSLQALKPTAIEYAFAVNQLGYYCLHWSPNNTEITNDFVNSAIKQLKTLRVKPENRYAIELLTANLTFYKTLEEIQSLENATDAEIQSSKVKLVATNSLESLNGKGSNVIPAFSTINLKTATSVASKLEQMYYSWKSCLTEMPINEYNLPHGNIAPLRLIIIAAELSKFYRYKSLEIKFWKLAYHLATSIEDYRCTIYITGRSLMSRYVKNDWIENANSVIETYLKTEQSNKNTELLTAIAMFKMILADYYYCSGRTAEADKLFEEAKNLGIDLDIGSNSAIYIFSLYLVLTYQLPNGSEAKKSAQYTDTIARILYTMLSLDDLVTNFKNLEKNLLNLDMLLFVSSHVAIRMNSLYSSREITAHLSRRLDICHTRVSVLRAAEILKYLCIIDLSKNQLDDCEVKLQGLEHILQIEMNNMLSYGSDRILMKTKTSELEYAPVDRALTDPVRDIPQNDTSPILRRERFAPPEFVKHDKSCKCFMCTNEPYNFLVFSCTHIRAQLYHLQNLKNYAREHFEGAWMIRKSIMNFTSTKNHEQYQIHGYTIDYLLFLLDYVRFLKRNAKSYEEDNKKYIFEALYLCELYQLQGHPIFLSVMEIVFEDRFEAVFSQGFPVSELIYPRPEDIDISEYNETKVDLSNYVCITPAKEAGNSPRPEKKTTPIRKNLAPPVSWPNLTTDVMQIEDDDLSPTITKPEQWKKRQVIRVKPVRRRLAEDADFCEEDKKTKEVRKSRTKSENVEKHVTLKDLIDEAIPIAPESTRKLHALRKQATDAAVTNEQLQMLIAILEEVKTDHSERPKNRSTSRRILENLEPSSVHLKSLHAMIKKLNTMLGIAPTSASSNSHTTLKSSREKAKDDSGINSLAKKMEKISINSAADSSAPKILNSTKSSIEGNGKKSLSTDIRKEAKGSGKRSTNSAPKIIVTGDSNDVVNNSDDEIVESTIIEPRRSRRLATGKKSTTEAKPTFNRL